MVCRWVKHWIKNRRVFHQEIDATENLHVEFPFSTTFCTVILQNISVIS